MAAGWLLEGNLPLEASRQPDRLERYRGEVRPLLMRLRIVTLRALATRVSGCGAGGAPTTAADPTSKLYLEVQNRSAYRMTITMVLNGVSTRLGQVNAGATTRLEVPKTLVTVGVPVRFIAQPTVAGRAVTEELLLIPGQTVRFTIPPG